MPYEWVAPTQADSTAELHLWPYRSLPKRGFVVFFAITLVLVMIPLLSVLGLPHLWVILAFFGVVIGAAWFALQRSYRDGIIIEELRLWTDRVTLSRTGPRKITATWDDNPYWVKVLIDPEGGPVPHYLTLKGKTREVEIGSFLSEDERIALHGELISAFAQVR